MCDLSDKVVAAKTALFGALGENVHKYLANMKLWFRYKWSKEEFDSESRKFLTPDKMHLHNQFLIAILNKIDAFQTPEKSPLLFASHNNSGPAGSTTGTASGGSSSSRSRKRKRSSRAVSDRVTFEPYDFLDFIVEDNLECIKPTAGTDANVQILPTQRYCVQELFLPDAGFVLGRFLIGAWEVGLTNVEDNVAEYVAMAVQVLLKNLISAIIMNRKHYKVSGDGSFYYDVGAPLKDPSLRNTVTRQKIDDGPLELDKEITSPNFMRRSNEDGVFLSACEEIEPQRREIITLKDAQRAFNDHNLIASHSVYFINMERLTQMLH
ncbi:PREDICTED: transcriptional adapter 1-like [Bactrocera latifrons]|uniref:Transcriptional adapter 1 n=2 Tax=Bactrocera latifrons TaxID=174628 RepID=A0A0K8VKF7_BACLA|nr:PREDICTED: transcriptional adapter 1-like [Bactrocera latifrons]